VRGVLSGGGEGWFGRLFTLPHTLIGIGATAYWLFLWCWAWFGADVDALVTGTEVQESRKGGTTYLVRYEYRTDGELKSGSSAVSFGDYNRYKAEGNRARVTVHHLSFWLFDHTTLREHVSLWNPAGGFTIWVLFWDTAIGLAVYMLWIKPLRTRWLYKYGQTASGVVVGKRTQSGKGTRYYVSYVFQQPLTGEQLKGEVEVPQVADYDGASIHQPVTVLFAPTKPKRSTIYEFGGYGLKDCSAREQGEFIGV
jgi:hypothetical protein